jgi:hypothetical protein
MYADDTKIFAVIKSEADKTRLQDDMDSITDWTMAWQMQLNVKKCKVMHISTSTSGPSDYFMNEIDDNGTVNRIKLEITTSERDLGVEISNVLKPSNQANKAAAKANNILSSLKNSFVSRDSLVWKQLYSTYVRPHTEFAVQAWSPYLKKDIAVLERVQHRASKIPQSMKGKNYEERCAAWNITSLETRRTRGDLIQKFKFENSIDEINWHANPISIPPRAGHRTRFHREITRNCLPRYHFFNNRVSAPWNSLPNFVALDDSAQLDRNSTNRFKNRLDNFLLV